LTSITENSTITLKIRVSGKKKSFLITYLTSNKSCRELMHLQLELRVAKVKAQQLML